jgi:predicted kinase
MSKILRKLIREVLTTDTRPKLYVLVGPPAIGKTGWVEDNAPDAYIISRDAVVDAVREPLGMKYDHMFHPENRRHQSEVDRIHRENIAGAVASGKDIVVDMTNMGVNSRRGALRVIQGHEDEYEKIAVIFDHRGKEDLVRSSAERRAEKLGDKNIPKDVMTGMFDRFEMPTREEGFDRIIVADTTKAIGK